MNEVTGWSWHEFGPEGYVTDDTWGVYFWNQEHFRPCLAAKSRQLVEHMACSGHFEFNREDCAVKRGKMKSLVRPLHAGRD